MRSGCIAGSILAFVRWKRCFWNAVSMFHTKRSADGLRSSGLLSPVDCDADNLSPVISGIWTKSPVTIKGRKFWLWRAVDQNGIVLDEILQSRRNTAAAKRLLARLMKKHGRVPKRFITDKLRSYGAAKREIAPGVEHRSHKGLNNRAENSHLPFRKRERAMQGFRSPGALQRFVSIHSAIRNCFSVPARRRSALTIRYHRLEAFDAWNAVVNVG